MGKGQKFWQFSSRNRAGHEPHPKVKVIREAVLIFWSHGYTMDDIAYRCGIDTDTVAKHLRAARKAGDERARVRQWWHEEAAMKAAAQ